MLALIEAEKMLFALALGGYTIGWGQVAEARLEWVSRSPWEDRWDAKGCRMASFFAGVSLFLLLFPVLIAVRGELGDMTICRPI